MHQNNTASIACNTVIEQLPGSGYQRLASFRPASEKPVSALNAKRAALRLCRHRIQRRMDEIGPHRIVMAEADIEDPACRDAIGRHERFRAGDRGSLPPLRDGLLVDAVALRKRPQAGLPMLYRSTDRPSSWRPRGESGPWCLPPLFGEDRPSKAGIKHLVRRSQHGCQA